MAKLQHTSIYGDKNGKITDKEFYFQTKGLTEEGLELVKILVNKFRVTEAEWNVIKEYTNGYGTVEEFNNGDDYMYRIRLIDFTDTCLEYYISIEKGEETKRTFENEKSKELLKKIKYDYEHYNDKKGIDDFFKLDFKYIDKDVIEKFNTLRKYISQLDNIKKEMKQLFKNI